MEESFLENNDQRIFTLNDVKKLARKLKKKIFRAVWIGAVLGFLLISLKVPQYKVEATFKEENEKKEDSLLHNFMGGAIGSLPQPQAATLMKSSQVLRPLIEKLGLQAVVPIKKSLFSKVFCRIWDNWKAERGLRLKDPDSFIFQDVKYVGDLPLFYTIRFTDFNHFSLFDKKNCLGSWMLGEEVCLPEVSLKMAKIPQDIKVGTLYPLKINPWIIVVESIRKELQIQGSKNNKSILELFLFHRDRHLAVQILNELMFQYQRYLKFDHDQTSLGQLDYLNQKQEQIYNKMSDMFKEHASYLKHSLETKGIAGLKDEMQTLLIPYHALQQSLLRIDLELSRLTQMGKEGSAGGFADESPFSIEYQKIVCKIQDLKQERDFLEVSLQKDEFFEQIESKLADRQQELKSIRDRREKVQYLLEISKGEQEKTSNELFDANDSLVFLEHPLRGENGQGLFSEGISSQDFTPYLVNYIRLLSVQEKIVQEKCLYANNTHSHFDGIDINTVRTLFFGYNTKLDTVDELMQQYQELIEKIGGNDFEITSLSAILKDPLSQNLIQEANKISIQLKEEKYHSAKEGERWREEVAFQKKVLEEHLQQLYKVEKLSSELIREKIERLRQIGLDCINREISVLHERMNDSIKERKESLFQEKQIIQKKMEELRSVSADFPEKWRQEKWLDLNIDMGLKMIQVMTELVEGKTVAQHLHHVESKPLDFALAPILPKKPGLFTSAALGACLAGFSFFSACLLSSILSGFPTTIDKLKAMKYPVSGQISSLCDGPLEEPATGSDLELLRQLSFFIDHPPQAKVIGLIEGKGPDYSYALAENLSRRSLRSLIIRCDFDKTLNSSDVPGLLQVYSGEIKDYPFRKQRGFDCLTAGGFTVHGTEIIQSKFFQDTLESLKTSYDSIFVLFRSPLLSAESQAALRFCDKVIVTVAGEPAEELTPFMQWAYHEGKSRLTFIISEMG